MPSLKGKTLFITGASRGIGLAIAKRAAADGANVAIASKTSEPHPKLPGTIHSAALEVEAAGGKALAIACDIRDELQVVRAVQQAAEKFGGIDICVNNASAIQLSGTLQTDLKRYDLMNQVNARGTFLVGKTCIPFLRKATNPHILTLSPPLDMKAKWFAPHVAYSMAKFGMSLCTLGWAEEFRKDGIAANSLWPRTTIATAAVQMLGGEPLVRRSRTPEIMADAAHAILTRPSREFSGNFCIDDAVLWDAGVRDFAKYAAVPGARERDLQIDFFVPDDAPRVPR
jgi:citronellol/citronellal dehydrogenase